MPSRWRHGSGASPSGKGLRTSRTLTTSLALASALPLLINPVRDPDAPPQAVGLKPAT